MDERIETRSRAKVGRTVLDPVKPRSSARIVFIAVPIIRSGFREIEGLPRPPGFEESIQRWIDESLASLRTFKKVGFALRRRDERDYNRFIRRFYRQISRAAAHVQALPPNRCVSTTG